MTGSAQLDFSPPSQEPPAGIDSPVSDLRLQAVERLAAHRRRRASSVTTARTASRVQSTRKANPIAARVAARYAQTPSYRAFLAEQARLAMEQAAAAAEAAMRNAEAVVAAQQELLGELELWAAPQEFSPDSALTFESPSVQAASRSRVRKHDPFSEPSLLPLAEPEQPISDTSFSTTLVSGLTVRLYEELGRPPIQPPPTTASLIDPLESLALDEEIAFRQSPVFEDYKAFLAREIEPPTPLPANLLEFPRQLIAARKARPRLAEGPLRDEPGATATRQLRIFEVEAEHISTAPAQPAPQPEWHNIRLDAAPQPIISPAIEPAQSQTQLAPIPNPQTAPLALRAMSFLVDLGLVLAAGIAFAAIFVRLAGFAPGGIPGLIAAGVTLMALFVLYQFLFFSFNGQTPGMLYARIDFCTLSDDNPTRSAIRKRILAQFIAACPLGLGLLWALLDEDGLGWHDRISRMYQRAY